MLIIASDPGLRGAIAAFDTERDTVEIFDMPTLPRELASGKVRDLVDEGELLGLMRLFADMGAQYFYLEKVGGMPGQGGHASFMFGSYVAAIRVAAKAAGLVVAEVAPAVWKLAMRAPRDKTAARNRASELRPAWAHHWPLKKHDGRAEAALLAIYGARELGAAR